MKRKVIIAVGMVLAALLLIPVPLHLKDGGTVEYRALVYNIQDVHRLNPDTASEKMYLEGTVVEVMGMEIYNSVR